ncbi:hypothetical protein BGX26_009930 [Mortierella sp. AD094]|nr:hypothetical protein BGX26_009930 [Mortierella sp. AD094]
MPDPATSIQKADPAHLNLNILLKPLPSVQHQSNISSTKTSEMNSSSGHSIRVVRAAPSLITLDDYNLISLGYKPVMSRSISWVSTTGIAVTSSNVLCGIVALYGLPLTNGGPAWATWSYLAVGIMSCVVSLCLAELAASYPTTAGVHHWVYQLASSG